MVFGPRTLASRWLARIVLVAFCAAAIPAVAADGDARVVILNGTDPYLPAYLEIDRGMRAGLSGTMDRNVAYFSEPLDAQRFEIGSFEPELVAALDKKYEALRVDFVVAISRPALEFFRHHGAHIWPGARVVFSGWPGETVERTGLPPGSAAVIATPEFDSTIGLARRLQPGARRIVVVTGASDLDRINEQDMRRRLSNQADTMQVEFLNGLPLPELVSRVAAEPPNSIILYLSQFRDRAGRPYTPREVLRAISARSVAPVYGVVETYLGKGMAAGVAESLEQHGRLIAGLVRDRLSGKTLSAGWTQINSPGRCVADARALKHWSLDEGRLPHDCEVFFADTPIWRQYLWQILVTLGILVGQTLLIVTLVFQRRRRRVAEAESQARLAELAHMNRRVAMGGLAASIAHELNQPLGAIHNNAAAARILLNADPPRLEDVAEILDDIQRDDRRASDVISRVRGALRKDEVNVREMNLNETIGESVKLLAAEADARGVSFKLELDAGLASVRADPVQVQQVIVNLVLNAMEAMCDQRGGARQILIRSRRADDRCAEVSVVDSGPGIPAAELPRIFDPFVTTKETGLGMGLAISRTIVEASGGHIRAENLPTGGAAFRLTLPFDPGCHS